MRREKRPVRRSAALLLTAALLCGALCGCGDDGTGKGFRFPLSGEPAQLDPQVSADRASLTLISVLFEGLTRIDALPDATLTQKVTHGEVGSTVVPKWEKLDDAARYQIELYNKTTVDGQAKYLLQALYSTYGQTRQLLTGILPQEDYVIVVRAYDGQGTLLGIYGHDAFSTKENGTDQPDPNDPLIPTDPDDGRTDGRDDVPKTGVEVPLGAVAALAVSVAAVSIVQRKKKTR